MRMSLDIRKITVVFGKISQRSDNARPLLKAVAAFHLRQTTVTFQGEGKREGHEAWKPFSDQYTRKTDGVTVPAWGGVPKLYGKGQVKGRKRPSGKRITPSSKLLQDTGTLKGSFMIVLLENKKVIYGSRLAYSGQHQYGLDGTPRRPMLFFTIGDEDTIRTINNNWVVNEVLKT